MKYAICSHCNSETPAGSPFCQNCKELRGNDKHADTVQTRSRYKKCILGHVVEPGAVMCRHCGNSVEAEIFRLCKKCGNEFSGNSCRQCEEVEKKAEPLSQPQNQITCSDCGSSNIIGAEKCCKCGNLFEAKSDVSPNISPRVECAAHPDFWAQVKDGDVIGREGQIDPSGLPNSQRISRIHATFLKVDGQWSLRAEKTTHPTKIGIRKLEPGEIVPLTDGTHIVLADTVFIFRSA